MTSSSSSPSSSSARSAWVVVEEMVSAGGWLVGGRWCCLRWCGDGVMGAWESASGGWMPN